MGRKKDGAVRGRPKQFPCDGVRRRITNFQIDDDTWILFKEACHFRGVAMSSTLRAMVGEFIEDVNRERGNQ